MIRLLKYHFLVLLCGLLLLFSYYFFSKEVKRGFMKETDFAVTVKLQEKINTSKRLHLVDFIGNVFEGSTFIAGPWMSMGFLGFLTIAAFVNLKKKTINLRVLLIPVLFGLLVFGEIYGKSVVHHPSPPFFMIKNPTTIFPKYYINEAYSYPSGHDARAVFISCVIYFLLTMNYLLRDKRKKLLIISGLTGYVLLVSISRIYLGHHWLSDVIGGGFLGGSFGIIVLSAL